MSLHLQQLCYRQNYERLTHPLLVLLFLFQIMHRAQIQIYSHKM